MPGENKEVVTTFKALGVCDYLVRACNKLGWKNPTPFQAEALPHAFEGKSLVGPVETGFGKMGAFSIPILQDLLKCPQASLACVLTPTREIAYQIAEHFEALGSGFFLRFTLLVEGIDMEEQAESLSMFPHIIVATPERLLDHLKKDSGFNIWGLKYLVLHEADRLLSDEFGKSVGEIMKLAPPTPRCRTYLFFVTETMEVTELRCTRLRNHVLLPPANTTVEETLSRLNL